MLLKLECYHVAVCMQLAPISLLLCPFQCSPNSMFPSILASFPFRFKLSHLDSKEPHRCIYAVCMYFINLNRTPQTHIRTHSHTYSIFGILFNVFNAFGFGFHLDRQCYSCSLVTFLLIDVVACANDCVGCVYVFVCIWLTLSKAKLC